MKEFYLEQFISEIKKVESNHAHYDIKELKSKASKIIDAFLTRRLFLHDSETYALVFIAESFPLYFSTFHQQKAALSMLLCFIKEDESYLDLPEIDLPKMVNYVIFIKTQIKNSYEFFSEFFNNDEEEQERILCAIKNLRWLYSEEGIRKQFEILDGSVEDEISLLAGLLRDIKTDDYLNLYFGKERDFFESRVQRILSTKIVKQELLGVKNEIRGKFEEASARPEIFKKNGFRLFDYLIKNHLSSGIGWKTEMAFFFRIMEYESLIECTHKRFWDFLESEYPNLEPMGKIKSLHIVDSETRRQIYYSAKRTIGLK